jgi:dienelactone hydrolase
LRLPLRTDKPESIARLDVFGKHDAIAAYDHDMTRALATLLALLWLPCAQAQNQFDGPTGKPYVYKTSAGKERKMELFFPPNHDPKSARVPGMILFHGGGWQGGHLSQFRAACAYFAKRGLVCATAEYQMLDKQGKAALPAGTSFKRVCVTDATSAIRWFKSNAAMLGMDPARVITGGGSAGGHISALATMNPALNDPKDPQDIDTKVVAYLWFNPAFATDDTKDPEIDILTHMNAGLVPSIVFFGDQDEWKKGWDVAHDKWKKLGVKDLQLHMAKGQKHSFFNKDPWRTVTLIAADEFLVKHGLLTGKSTLQAPASGESLIQVP